MKLFNESSSLASFVTFLFKAIVKWSSKQRTFSISRALSPILPGVNMCTEGFYGAKSDSSSPRIRQRLLSSQTLACKPSSTDPAFQMSPASLFCVYHFPNLAKPRVFASSASTLILPWTHRVSIYSGATFTKCKPCFCPFWSKLFFPRHPHSRCSICPTWKITSAHTVPCFQLFHRAFTSLHTELCPCLTYLIIRHSIVPSLGPATTSQHHTKHRVNISYNWVCASRKMALRLHLS